MQGAIHRYGRRIERWMGKTPSQCLPCIGDDEMVRVDKVRGPLIREILHLENTLVSNVSSSPIIKSKVCKIHMAVFSIHDHVSSIIINKIHSQE